MMLAITRATPSGARLSTTTNQPSQLDKALPVMSKADSRNLTGKSLPIPIARVFHARWGMVKWVPAQDVLRPEPAPPLSASPRGEEDHSSPNKDEEKLFQSIEQKRTAGNEQEETGPIHVHVPLRLPPSGGIRPRPSAGNTSATESTHEHKNHSHSQYNRRHSQHEIQRFYR